MSRLPSAVRHPLCAAAVAMALLGSWPRAARAQDADPLPPPAEKRDTVGYPTIGAGEFTPGLGWDLIKTKMGTLNISFYGLFRYIDQVPAPQFFEDHLGRVRQVTAQNSLNWQRTFGWLTGWFYTPKFRYNITFWSLGSTQQTLLFGNLQYRAAPWLVAGVGILPNLTARSLQGSWPFWAGSDRQMATEFFRAGFSSGVFVGGNITNKLTYTLSVNNNISQLGVVQANDTRNMFYSGSMRWQPTTGEYGPRNGFNDFEYHTKAATQFGFSSGTGRESRYAPLDQAPNNTQIKLSDGINVFELGALADGVTVQTLTYTELAVDAGVKYRGFNLEGEYYWRTLDDFVATGPLPLSSVYDHGFMAQASYMAIPKTLDAHVFTGYVDDQFRRFPYELGGGLNYYPSHTRSWRINLHVMHIDKSPASSFFGYYVAGQTGTIASLGMDILF